ncbi:MAG: transposase [Patescibacteria group bacterium]|nr:transposase [Patescibacteria group bacterium]MBU2509489.1 transposase [Patescibacteria group bacterium]
MREILFAVGNFYHIYNHGIDQRKIFQDTADFRRFYASMFLFNNSLYSHKGGRSPLSACKDLYLRLLDENINRLPLVNIVSYCLLPNHFHILLEQAEETGINKFMHRLGMGYAHYYNIRYERTGRLFEGPFQAKIVNNDAQFMHLPRYIHLNALDMTNLKWREGMISDWKEADSFLDNYEWSSHLVYKGMKEPLPVIERSQIKNKFPSVDNYVSFLRKWSGRYTPIK